MKENDWLLKLEGSIYKLFMCMKKKPMAEEAIFSLKKRIYQPEESRRNYNLCVSMRRSRRSVKRKYNEKLKPESREEMKKMKSWKAEENRRKYHLEEEEKEMKIWRNWRRKKSALMKTMKI